MKKGNFTLGVGTVITLGSIMASSLTSYFTTINTQAAQMNEVKSELKEDISIDRQRIATVEEAIKTIKDNQMEQRNDIKEILKFVKQ